MKKTIKLYLLARVAAVLLLALLTAQTAGANITVTYGLGGNEDGNYGYCEIRRQDDTTLKCTFSQVLNTSYVNWTANETHGVDDEYDITFTPDKQIRCDINNNIFLLDNQAVNMTIASTSYIIVSVTLKDFEDNVQGSVNNVNAKSCVVSMPASTGQQNIAKAVIELASQGSCGTNATWALTQDSNGKYTRLTISGTGAMQDYSYTTANSLWRTDAPWGWQTLTSVTIGNGITSIGDYAFCGCQQLSSITIGADVQNIGTASVNHCDALTEVTLPASVATIEQGAFENSTGLARVKILKSDGIISGVSAFNGCHNDLVIGVPTPALALQYPSAANWSAYATRIRVVLGSYFFKATGSVTDAAYEIADGDDLRHLAAVVNQDGQYCSGLTFRQTQNIDLSSGGNFMPIGERFYHTLSDTFKGTYDGGNKTISGLTVNGNYQFAGLFGWVIGGTVKNVCLVSPNVTSSLDYNEAHVGALVGYSDKSSSILNCFIISPTVNFTGTVNNNVGAVCGTANSISQYQKSTLTNVYYYNSSLNAIGENINASLSNVTRVGPARKVTLGSGVSTTVLANAPENGFQYGGNDYYREGITLTLSSSSTPPTGYSTTYYANGNAISGSEYTVNATDGDVTITAISTQNTATLTDGNDLSALSAWAGKTCTVTYTRSFTNGKPSTVCLPFAYTKKTGDGSFYEFTNIEKNGSGEYVATMTDPGVSTLTANKPYLYMPNATGAVDFSGTYTIPATLTAGETTSNGWTFKGTYTTITWSTAPTGTYGFSASDYSGGISQGQFVKVGTNVSIKPMRCYLVNESFVGAPGMNRAASAGEQLPATIKVRLVNADGEVTAIGTMQTKTGEVNLDGDAWYTLDGRRMEGKPSTKGIYINNNKKVIIK